MANFYAYYPSSASANASVGTNGVTAPTSSTEIGTIDSSGNLQGVSATNPLPATVTSSVLPTGAATASNQVLEITQLNNIDTAVAALNVRTAGALVPTAYNEVDLTYIASGNGAGQVGTAVYKLSGSTVATLTLTYNSSNQLSTVVKS